MSLHRHRCVLASLLVVLGACATRRSIPELPSMLGENGLLVARFYVLGMEGIENASVEIDGKYQEGALREGYLALPLAPGTHALGKLRTQGWLLSSAVVDVVPPIRPARGGSAPHFIYIPGTTRTVAFTTLGVDRSFTIEAGRVTNLGLIVYLPVVDPPDVKRAVETPSRRFHVIALDNGAEVQSFLETNYPALTSSLKDRRVLLAPAPYLDAARLPDLRLAIAAHESKGRHVINAESQLLVYGRAGTIVSATLGGSGKPQSVRVLPTGTLADVVGGVRQGDRFTFVTSDAQVLSWDGAKLDRTPLLQRVHPTAMGGLGRSGLLIVDNRLRVLTAKGPCEPWVAYEGMMSDRPRSDLSVIADIDGAYVSVGFEGQPELYWVDAGGSVPRPVDAPRLDPRPMVYWHVLAARPAGLFVIYTGESRFHFRPRGSSEWLLRQRPLGKCGPLRIDEQGTELSITCDDVPYRSLDSGATWTSQGT